MKGGVWFVLMFAMLIGACGEEAPGPSGSGSLAGLVVVSGPLRNAQIAIDQLDSNAPGLTIRTHVGDTMTSADGRFEIDVGKFNGTLLVTARGGEFTDLVSQKKVQLDPTNALETVVPLDLFEARDDVLVSPVGHLIAARTRGTNETDVEAAHAEAAEHLNRHFAGVDWGRTAIASLQDKATSPTEPVRAALVQAALSMLATDIVAEAGASEQDVNVYTLTQALAEDVASDTFDGQDGNSSVAGEGLQVGVCPPKPGCATITDCGLGVITAPEPGCRPMCDLYANTVRSILSGEMQKVVTDDMPGGLNQTGLKVPDILPVARSMSDNVDEVLFGSACSENLDRLPPTIVFIEAMTPPDAAFVHGTISIQVNATDDAGPAAVTSEIFLVLENNDEMPLPDADGDPTNSTARAIIDTVPLTTTSLKVRARAKDLAGNTAAVSRIFTVDNTLPVVTLSPTGFLVDGTTFWTDQAAPVLTGSVVDTSPVKVKAVIGTQEIQADVSGGTFTITLGAGTIDLAGADVSIVATDEAKNEATIVQKVRADLTPPELNVLPSTVHNELGVGESITFSTGSPNLAEVPTHIHGGLEVDLALGIGPNCPVVNKHAYLLGQAPPAYGIETASDGSLKRNPLHVTFLSGDSGVGVVVGSTKFRVGRRDANGTTVWLTQLLSAGTSTPAGAGFERFDPSIFAEQVPGLATTEGVYDVELVNQDRLGRSSTTSRCFALRLLAPPLDFQPPLTIGMPLAGAAAGHRFALNTLSLNPGGGQFDEIAAALLNPGGGASLLDQPIVNGTAETVFLTVTVTATPTVQAARTFVMHNARTSFSDVSLKCEGAGGDPNNCNKPSGFTAFTSTTNSLGPVNNPTFPVKVFELDTANQPTTEVPCIAPCPGMDAQGKPTFRFAIPPRAPPGQTGAPFRKFVAMTMLGPVTDLHPSEGGNMSPTFAAPPFVDTALATTRITGKLGTSSTGCTDIQFPAGVMTCKQRSTVRPYRALTRAELQFATPTASAYATSATPTIAPVQRADISRNGFGWITNEGALPTFSLP